MDYSLIVGIHDCDRADMESAEMNQRVKETEEDSNEEENGVDEDINGLGGVPTPPDSPQPIHQPFTGEIDPNIERYGIRCSEGLYPIICS
jgi:hypothetical protein